MLTCQQPHSTALALGMSIHAYVHSAQACGCIWCSGLPPGRLKPATLNAGPLSLMMIGLDMWPGVFDASMPPGV